jgi:phosphate/sulfate permease
MNGIPLSVSVTVTSGLIGLRCADMGIIQSLKRHHFIKIALIWVVVPFLSSMLTYSLLRILGVVLK